VQGNSLHALLAEQIHTTCAMSASESPERKDRYRCWCPLDVHVCAVDDNAILLDLRRDKYFAVPGRAARALAIAVPGWPMPPCSELECRPPPSETEVRRIVQFYLENGVLTANESEGKPASPVCYPPPRDLMPLGFDLDAIRSISWKDSRNFVCAATLAAYRWRTLSLHALVRKVAARKARAIKHTPFDCRLAAELACSYRRLQALVFTGRNRCLLQSLAFANFLSFYGVFPDWIFGVQIRPFAAHCWLQQDHYLLNETPDGVKRFTPIFAV
jgi:Transglutaminase-like superfamily